MHRIDGAGHVDHMWVGEDPATFRPPTEITPEWMNAVQEELAAVIAAASIVLEKGNNAQLLSALRSPGVFQTQGMFDISTLAATTEFVWRSRGNFAAASQITSATVLSEAAIGQTILCSGASGYPVTLPLAASAPTGSAIHFVASVDGIVISRAGADNIILGNTTAPSVTLNIGDSIMVVSNGASWLAYSGSAQLKYASGAFGSSFGFAGYQRLPSGLIVQWGQVGTIAGGGSVSVTLPIAFPSAVMSIIPGSGASAAGVPGINAQSISPSTIKFWNQSASIATQAGSYLALGW